MNFENKFPLFPMDLVDSVQSIVYAGGALKSVLQKPMLGADRVDYFKVQEYLGKVNNFLRIWHEYGEELQEKMRNCGNLTVGIVAPEYNDVKEYMYAKYDFVSILPFTDGLIKGINDGKFLDANDVNDFFDYTIKKAFKNREDTAGDVIAAVTELSGNISNSAHDNGELSLFKSCKSYKWFDNRDRADIYRAIEKTLDFLSKHFNIGTLVKSDFIQDTRNNTVYAKTDYRGGKVDSLGGAKIAMINKVVDYISYTLAIYATRIYVMSRYAGPYISNETSKILPKTEAVEIDDGSFKSMPISASQLIDDANSRDITKYINTALAYSKFLTTIGADASDLPNESNSGFVPDAIISMISRNCKKETNMLCSKLSDNVIHNGLTRWNANWCLNGGSENHIAEVNQMMKSSLYNNLQGLGNTSTPKQEMLVVIANIQPKNETLDGYTKLATDIVTCILTCMGSLEVMWNDTRRLLATDGDRNYYNAARRNYSITTRQELYDINKMCKEFYTDLAQALISRCRDIEFKINQIKNTNMNAIMADLSIKVPGDDKKADSINVSSAVPDTTRIPMSVIGIDAKAHYEYLQMQDEATKHIYGLGDDPYFTEGTAERINASTSFIDSLIRKFIVWFDNEKFKLACKWVTDHKDELLSATYEGTIEGVTPYLKNIKLDAMQKVSDTMKNMPNEVTKETMDSADKIKELIKKLYADVIQGQDLYALFITNIDNASDKSKATEEAVNKYKNLVLFGNTNAPENVTVNLADAKFLEGEDNLSLKTWIGTITGAPKLQEAIKTSLNGALDGMKNIKKKAIDLSKQQPKTESVSIFNEADENPPAADDTKNAEQKTDDKSTANNASTANNTTDSNSNNNSNDKKDDNNATPDNPNMATLLNGTSRAFQQLIGNLYVPITTAIRDQYKYITQAYSKKKQ